MKYSKKNEQAYQEVYQPLYEKLNSGRLFPNISAIRNKIKDLNRRMDVLSNGVFFASSLEEVEIVEDRLDVLRGQKRAYQDILDYVNWRINDTKLANK